MRLDIDALLHDGPEIAGSLIRHERMVVLRYGALASSSSQVIAFLRSVVDERRELEFVGDRCGERRAAHRRLDEVNTTFGL